MEESDPKGHPVVNPVNSPEEAEQNFSILSYSKGFVKFRKQLKFLSYFIE